LLAISPGLWIDFHKFIDSITCFTQFFSTAVGTLALCHITVTSDAICLASLRVSSDGHSILRANCGAGIASIEGPITSSHSSAWLPFLLSGPPACFLGSEGPASAVCFDLGCLGMLSFAN